MRHLQLTLDTLAENLALDEALLDHAEARPDTLDTAVLRLWEARDYGVVLGRSSKADVEVDLDACRRDRVPVLRRSSGGGTILTGPGCLMYAVVLSCQQHPQLRGIDQAHAFVLSQLSRMLSTGGTEVRLAGTSDLSIADSVADPRRKFSGNAMRMKRDYVLYHGTLLYDFDLRRIPRWLAAPTRMPDYRQDRQHAQFVANLNVDRPALVQTLLRGWQANEALSTWPADRTATIVNEKYRDNPKWVVHYPTS